ncbi:MAG: hypothetical protein CBD18_01400 [Opitutales bacterium TMED158]|nr:MAG: hypothetical protein CBD18_01400 [Opitutales bacterium TMED158]
MVATPVNAEAQLPSLQPRGLSGSKGQPESCLNDPLRLAGRKNSFIGKLPLEQRLKGIRALRDHAPDAP